MGIIIKCKSVFPDFVNNVFIFNRMYTRYGMIDTGSSLTSQNGPFELAAGTLWPSFSLIITSYITSNIMGYFFSHLLRIRSERCCLCEWNAMGMELLVTWVNYLCNEETRIGIFKPTQLAWRKYHKSRSTCTINAIISTRNLPICNNLLIGENNRFDSSRKSEVITRLKHNSFEIQTEMLTWNNIPTKTVITKRFSLLLRPSPPPPPTKKK